MDINNLNTAELKQLQFLLNKMNPNQPTEKLYLDPVNKMIDKIMEEFNFDKVQDGMRCLGWTWVDKGIPNIENIKQTAERLLRNAAELRLGDYKNEHWEQGVVSATGGFQATAYCNESKTKIIGLDLKFVLVDWDYWDEIDN